MKVRIRKIKRMTGRMLKFRSRPFAGVCPVSAVFIYIKEIKPCPKSGLLDFSGKTAR
jgi:hypothetical protein